MGQEPFLILVVQNSPLLPSPVPAGAVIVKQQHPFCRLPGIESSGRGSSFRTSRVRYDVSSRSWSKSKASFPSSRRTGVGGECNRASGGLMASRCKCSQSGTQATYPPTDALCQLTPYSLIILFSLLLCRSLFPRRPCPLSHSHTLARQTKLLY